MLQIPDQDVGWIATGWAVLVTWLVTLERRLLARPTREEQKEIAASVAANIKDQFTEIKTLLEKQNEQTALHRELMNASLSEIRTKVAVLRDRAGDDPLSDSGPHRRRM